MGNVSRSESVRHLPGSARKNVPYEEIQKLIESYDKPDVDEFMKIAERAKMCYNLGDEYHIWRVASMYHFMTTMDDGDHDIGQSQGEIVYKFQKEEAQVFEGIKSGDPSRVIKAELCMQYLHKATGNSKYLPKKATPRHDAVVSARSTRKTLKKSNRQADKGAKLDDVIVDSSDK